MDELCSLRPEALRISENGGPGLRGRLIDTVYLGELAQHTVEITGGARLKVAVLNPGPAQATPAGREVTLTINPQDVVLVPRE